MKCSNCNRDSDSLTLFVNAETGDKSQICIDCLVAHEAEIVNLDEADAVIQRIKKLQGDIAEIQAEYGEPDMGGIPEAIAKFIMTPAKSLADLSLSLANAEKDRENILMSMTEKERLEYKIAKAVTKEDYEEAARLKECLTNLPRGDLSTRTFDVGEA